MPLTDAQRAAIEADEFVTLVYPVPDERRAPMPEAPVRLAILPDETPRTRPMFPPAPVRGPWIRELDYRRGAVSGPFSAVPRHERVFLAGLVLLAAVLAVRIVAGLLP